MTDRLAFLRHMLAVAIQQNRHDLAAEYRSEIDLITGEPMQPAQIISATVHQAVNQAMRDEEGCVIVQGEDVIAGIVDALACFVASSPYVETFRGKRQYLDSIHEALNVQVTAYLAKKVDAVQAPKLIGVG